MWQCVCACGTPFLLFLSLSLSLPLALSLLSLSLCPTLILSIQLVLHREVQIYTATSVLQEISCPKSAIT